MLFGAYCRDFRAAASAFATHLLNLWFACGIVGQSRGAKQGDVMAELTDLTAVETAQVIAQGAASVTEVTQAHVARMDAVGSALNAVVDPMAEAALAQAASMDNARPDALPPLWGVPMTIKINVDLQGYANSNGIPALNKEPAPADSPVVANLKAAGGVILGRTSTPEFSLRFFTSNPIYGVTLNPWDKAVTPGGSSDGAFGSHSNRSRQSEGSVRSQFSARSNIQASGIFDKGRARSKPPR